MSALSGLATKRPSKAPASMPIAETLGRLHVDIPADLLKAAKLRAVQDDLSLRDLVIQALSAHLDR